MKNYIKTLSIGTALCAIISALIGIFYSFGGEPHIVTNIYGQEIELYGDGIYAYNSILKVGATKGTDIVIVFISILLLVSVFALHKRGFAPFLQTGLLLCILYSSSCLIFGVSFNRLFILYLIQFSFAFFAFILSLVNLIIQDNLEQTLYQKKLKGTALFMFIGGCSVFIWLSFIIPATLTGLPTDFIEIYTTEPTFVLDLAIILPSCFLSGIKLLQQKELGYKLASILLTLLTSVGIIVILQTIVQISIGFSITPGQLIGMVLSFVIMGAVALILNVRILKYAK